MQTEYTQFTPRCFHGDWACKNFFFFSPQRWVALLCWIVAFCVCGVSGGWKGHERLSAVQTVCEEVVLPMNSMPSSSTAPIAGGQRGEEGENRGEKETTVRTCQVFVFHTCTDGLCFSKQVICSEISSHLSPSGHFVFTLHYCEEGRSTNPGKTLLMLTASLWTVGQRHDDDNNNTNKMSHGLSWCSQEVKCLTSQHRIDFKFLMFVFKGLNGPALFIRDFHKQNRTMRSSSQLLMEVQRSRCKRRRDRTQTRRWASSWYQRWSLTRTF